MLLVVYLHLLCARKRIQASYKIFEGVNQVGHDRILVFIRLELLYREA